MESRYEDAGFDLPPLPAADLLDATRFAGTAMVLTEDEQILLEGCRKGDEKAWLALYRAYGSDVGFFLKGMLRASSDIDDLVQKVFLAFLSSLDRFRGEASIRTWLHRIARNIALHEIRSHARREKYIRAYAATTETEEQSAEGQVSARHRLALVQGLLGELTESFREVWVLREVMDFSVTEAAEVLEIEEATVRTRHYRARQKVLELLQEMDARDAAQIADGPSHLKLVAMKGGSA